MFLYVDDVIYCLEKLALDEKINKEIINIGPDEETTTVLELSNLGEETRYGGSTLYEIVLRGNVCSSDKARKL